MKQGISVRTNTKLSTSLRVDPKIVLGSQILQLSQAELHQAIEAELQENPALDRFDDFEEEVTHEEILKAVAPAELKPGGENHELNRSLPRDAGLEQDWVDLASGSDSLWDHLFAQLSVGLEPRLMDLAGYLIGSINDRGYITCSVEEAALACEALLEDAETVWNALRRCEPAGVGATDLRDCLMLQLRSADSDAEKVARLMLRKNWDDLVSRNGRAIMKAYGLEEETVQDAFEVIRSLNPFPGENFCGNSSVSHKEKAIAATPDVIITLDEIGFIVEIPGPSSFSLRVDPGYEKRKRQLEAKAVDPLEKRHVTEFVERANRFLDALTQRRQMLARIGRYLVEKQGGFVKTGEYRFLASLTRSQVAKDLGVHESTISRATAGKFIQLVTRDIVSFEVFFKPALRIQKMIEEILSTENPDNPLSDESVAKMLERRGIKVARRTVNKYRDRTKLLSRRMRRSA